jgi:hypothetical protein
VGGSKDAILRVGRAVNSPRCKGAVERAREELSGNATTLAEDLHDTGGQGPVVLELKGVALRVEELRLGVVAEEQVLEAVQEGRVSGSGMQLVLEFQKGKSLCCDVQETYRPAIPITEADEGGGGREATWDSVCLERACGVGVSAGVNAGSGDDSVPNEAVGGRWGGRAGRGHQACLSFSRSPGSLSPINILLVVPWISMAGAVEG